MKSVPKLFLILVLEFIALVVLTVTIIHDQLTEPDYTSNRFQVIEKVDNGFLDHNTLIVYDTETRVEYYIVENRGEIVMTPLFNADGSLVIYP